MIPVPGEAMFQVKRYQRIYARVDYCFVIFVIALIFQNGNPYNSIML